MNVVTMEPVQNTLIHEGKDMASVLYTYRSCVKALPQVKTALSVAIHIYTDFIILWQNVWLVHIICLSINIRVMGDKDITI